MRDQLEKEMDTCPYKELEPHIEKSNSFVVGRDIEFLDVAEALAADEVGKVKDWVESRQLVRPTLELLEAWGKTPEHPFKMIVIKPFLLIQPIVAN